MLPFPLAAARPLRSLNLLALETVHTLDNLHTSRSMALSSFYHIAHLHVFHALSSVQPK